MSEFPRCKRLGLTLLALAAAGLFGAGCNNNKNNTDAGSGNDAGGNDSGAMDSGLLSPTTITWTNVAPGQSDALATAVTAAGGTQYYTAFDSNGVPGVYSVRVGSPPGAIFSGDPLAMPSGLAISADDSTLYIADSAADLQDGGVGPDFGAVFTLAAAGGGQLTALAITGLQQPQAVTLSADGTSLIISAKDMNGLGGVFKVSAGGGAATELTMPGEVNDPGQATDQGGTLWVTEHRTAYGSGGLLQHGAAGATDQTNGYIQLGFPGSVVASAAGDTIYMAYVDSSGNGAISYQASAGTGTPGQVTLAPAGTKLKYPSGMSRGKNVNVFGLNDGEGGTANVYNGR